MSTCYLCHRNEGRGPDGLQINQCDRCDQDVCANCAEVDYDMVGDPPHYVNTQWICDSIRNPCQEAA
jgi:hypothetical protein